jgi:N-acetylmuramoyl-L-alanine amidase
MTINQPFSKQTPKDKRKTLNIILSALLLMAVVATVLVFYTDVFSTQEAEAAVVKQGATGSMVKTIQTKLKNWGYYTGTVDGIFGPKTVAAVKYFQSKNGLVADGIVGEKTAAKMGISLSGSTSQGSSPATSADTYLLARCVYAEARGEPYVGQVAVAAVILNRVRNPSFPNTISGVIYQPWAFTAVNDGQINLTPNETAMQAAKDALSGWDPTYGCVYYYNPKTATNAWIRSREIRLTIGRHVFCV